MSLYVWRDGRFIDRATGEAMKTDPARFQRMLKEKRGPIIVGDIEPHMHRGFYVSSRSKRKELEDRFSVVPYERVGDIVGAPTTPYSDKDERWQEWKKKKSDMVAKRAGLDPKASAIERQLSGELAAHKAKIKAKSKPKG